jgi:Fur family ferric uptake transcriptional regulator
MRAQYSTRPREQITDILRTHRRYLSAAEVFGLLKKAGGKASLSTVYRTLDLMQAKGEASLRTDDRGEASFVICEPTHHHHAICRQCGKVEDIACQAIEHLTNDLLSHHSFALDDHAMEFYGRCAACRA